MSTLVCEQHLFLEDGERFPWPVEYKGKPREFSVQWVFVSDQPDRPRDVMLAGLLILLNGDVSADYQRGWINLHLTEIPQQVQEKFR